MKSIFKAGLIFGLLSFPLSAAFAFDLTVTNTPGGPGKDYTLNWTAVTKATDTSLITYCVFTEFGQDEVDVDLVTPSASANFYRCFLDELTTVVTAGSGTRGFIVTSSDSFNGAQSISNTVYHSFVHVNPTANSGSLAGWTRTDGDGSQRGVNQIWKFGFKMDDDALITMRVYPPGTTFTTDANNFITGATNPPIKTLVDSTPRSGENVDGSIFASNNDDVWDVRADSAVLVTNGIYYIVVDALLDAGQSGYAVSPTRYSASFTIPVDVLRILNLTTTPITLTNNTATISYTLTGPATVKVLIVRSTASITVDGNGEVQPMNGAGAIDPSLIVSSITFFRQSGTNTEDWGGTDLAGTNVANGLYKVAISATGSDSRHALDPTGNDYFVTSIILIERSAGSNSTGGNSSSGDNAGPTLSALTIGGQIYNSVSPPSFTSAVTTVTVTLTDIAGINTINSAATGSTIQVYYPNGTLAPGNVTYDSATGVLQWVAVSSLTTGGTYSVLVTARDSLNNLTSQSANFTVSIQLTQSAFDAGTKIYPNPANNVSQVTIQYNLDVAATVHFEVFTILGERVYDTTFTDAAGLATHTWSLTNDSNEKVASGLYLIRITANSSGSSALIKRKVVVIR